MSLTLTNVNNILLVVMLISLYKLMISLVSLLNHTKAKMLFISLLAVQLEKVNIVVIR